MYVTYMYMCVVETITYITYYDINYFGREVIITQRGWETYSALTPLARVKLTCIPTLSRRNLPLHGNIERPECGLLIWKKLGVLLFSII